MPRLFEPVVLSKPRERLRDVYVQAPRANVERFVTYDATNRSGESGGGETANEIVPRGRFLGSGAPADRLRGGAEASADRRWGFRASGRGGFVT